MSQPTSLLKDRVQQSALTWFPDAPEFCGVGRRLVLGVVLWSIYDLRLLAAVGDVVARGVCSDLQIAVFDADEVLSFQEFQQMFPGIGEVFHMPVAGYWEDGQLKEAASGYAARELIGRLLGVDPSIGLESSSPTPR
jgi:hypothetical protein